MSVRLRLTRVGSKKNPIWRVVVADQRSPRDGRFIETIGHYNPQTDPSTIVIDDARLEHWLSRGAEPSGTVKNLIKAHASGPPATESAPAEQPAPAETAAPDEPEPAPAEPAEDAAPEQAAPGEAVAPAEEGNPAADGSPEESAG
jgi:small subunit ribosomal protein S16